MFLEIERAARHELVSIADFVRAALLEKLITPPSGAVEPVVRLFVERAPKSPGKRVGARMGLRLSNITGPPIKLRASFLKRWASCQLVSQVAPLQHYKQFTTRNKILAFFAPRPRIGFGFPASRGVFTKLEYLILNHPLAKVR
jgi:hypothetical protein